MHSALKIYSRGKSDRFPTVPPSLTVSATRLPSGERLNSLLLDEDVGWLQIAVSDAFTVRRVESFEDLPGIFERLLQRQRTC